MNNVAVAGWENLTVASTPSPFPCPCWNFFRNTTQKYTGLAIARHLNVNLTVLSLSYHNTLRPSYDDSFLLFLKDQSERGQAMQALSLKPKNSYLSAISICHIIYKTEVKSWPLTNYLDIIWLYSYISDFLLPVLLHILQSSSWYPWGWSPRTD